MATKITQDDILNINRTYLKLGTYAATARELGFSAGTIKKYIKPDFVDPDKIQLRKFSSEIKSIEETEIIWDLRLFDNELNEIKELWEEISI